MFNSFESSSSRVGGDPEVPHFATLLTAIVAVHFLRPQSLVRLCCSRGSIPASGMVPRKGLGCHRQESLNLLGFLTRVGALCTVVVYRFQAGARRCKRLRCRLGRIVEYVRLIAPLVLDTPRLTRAGRLYVWARVTNAKYRAMLSKPRWLQRRTGSVRTRQITGGWACAIHAGPPVPSRPDLVRPAILALSAVSAP